jgi:uncharacterized lipoprotein NlpE involved in copper resistance
MDFISMKHSFIALLLCAFFISCGQNNNSAKNTPDSTKIQQERPPEFDPSSVPPPKSLGFSGAFICSLPCPDCEKLEFIIQINDDGTYGIRQTFFGAKTPEGVARIGSYGTWEKMNKDLIRTKDEKSGAQYQFRIVNAKKIIMLDADGKGGKVNMRSFP